MITQAQINEFLSHRNLVLVRASRSIPVRGVSIDKELASKGYKITIVYLDESDPKSKWGETNEKVDGVIIAVSSAQAEQAVRQAIEAKFPRIWLQQGAESKAAIALCDEKGVPVIYGQCVLMFAAPVKSFHAFHRLIKKIFGKFPK